MIKCTGYMGRILGRICLKRNLHLLLILCHPENAVYTGEVGRKMLILSFKPKENIALFPAHRPDENLFGCYPAANDKYIFISPCTSYMHYEMSQHDNVWSHISCLQCQFKLINPIFLPI